jgi:hypothetical protein
MSKELNNNLSIKDVTKGVIVLVLMICFVALIKPLIEFTGFNKLRPQQISVAIYCLSAFFVMLVIINFINGRKKWLLDEGPIPESFVTSFNGRSKFNNHKYLEEKGYTAIAEIDKAAQLSGLVTYGSARYYIKYFFVDESGKKFSKIKIYWLNDLLFLPKTGDKIEVLYEKDYPENSMIAYEESKNANWYQLRKKYKIKFIKINNSTTEVF